KVAAEMKAAPEAKPSAPPLLVAPIARAAPAAGPATTAPSPAPAAEAPAPAPKSVPAARAVPTPAAPASRPGMNNDIPVELSRQGANLKLSFPFSEPTAAAVFCSADTLWIVFDSKSALDLSALVDEPRNTVREAEFSRDGDAAIAHPARSSASFEHRSGGYGLERYDRRSGCRSDPRARHHA